ncbi:MAG: hypothetical protein R6U32_05750 [Candidatus Woesearchaeota archaeon]
MGLEDRISGARKRLNKKVFDISNSFTLTRPLHWKDALVGGVMYGMACLGFLSAADPAEAVLAEEAVMMIPLHPIMPLL